MAHTSTYTLDELLGMLEEKVTHHHSIALCVVEIGEVAASEHGKDGERAQACLLTLLDSDDAKIRAIAYRYGTRAPNPSDQLRSKIKEHRERIFDMRMVASMQEHHWLL